MADDKDLKVDLKIDGLSQARLIRRGDHTELYQATQRQFGRRVAVKVYTADGGARCRPGPLRARVPVDG
jgi:hypothetical protein